jgi:hypothetical protein
MPDARLQRGVQPQRVDTPAVGVEARVGVQDVGQARRGDRGSRRSPGV